MEYYQMGKQEVFRIIQVSHFYTNLPFFFA
jgi:hypothetical protein